jgi:hypothetical protein
MQPAGAFFFGCADDKLKFDLMKRAHASWCRERGKAGALVVTKAEFVRHTTNRM